MPAERDASATVEGATPPARRPIEMVEIGWERIQLRLVVRGAPADGEPRWVQAGDAGGTMPPTWSAAGGELRMRFNVMVGPGQMPMSLGRWTLVDAAGRPLEIGNPEAVEPETLERLFPFRGGHYEVRPSIDPGSRHLVLDIDGRRGGRSRHPIKRLRSWFRRVIGPRRRIFGLLLRWYAATGTRTGRRVLFTSDSRAELSGNLAVVHERMVERGLDREYTLDSIFKPGIAARRTWRDRLRLPRLLARADVILLDDYQPIIYRVPPAPDVRIIQLWHASGAFKTVGYSRVGKPGGPSPYARRHKNYTHAIVSSRHDVPFYAEAFGIAEERVVPTGIPRMDRFFDEDQRARGRQRAIDEFPEIVGRRTILFAPTFRGSGPRTARYDYELIDFGALHGVCVEKDAVMILKMHPFVREAWPVPAALRDRLIDGTRSPIDVNDLLFAVDLLITDYSSIVFEYSTLLRPMLFFAYDLDEYVASRDFYVPFDEFVPGRIVRTFDELLDALRRDDYQAEKVPVFAARHFDHLDGTSTDRIIDQLILGR
ncbi:MAG: CDP-glycerol glycerophosphotransferase family protein [Candidatus Limnocylindria bacterium]